MTTWYSLASLSEIERLEEAWSDAPTEQPEICGMLLDNARTAVVSYAGWEDTLVPGIAPVTVDYVPVAPPGMRSIYTFSRSGAMVTVSAVISSELYDMPASAGPVTVDVPEGFRMRDGFLSGEDWWINVGWNGTGNGPFKIGARAEKGKTVRRTISYATSDPIVYPVTEFAPAVATWSMGARVELSRSGNLVTATVTPGAATSLPLTTQSYPAPHFAPTGTLQFLSKDARYAFVASLSNGMSFVMADSGPYLGTTAQWIADPVGTLVPTGAVPSNLVYAQLQHAKNLWNAGRAQQDGGIGGEGYSFTPRPLDKTIQQLIRPRKGVPNVF